MSRIIIVGASHAGLSCAERLRHHGFAGEITIFDREEGLPCNARPCPKPISKKALMPLRTAFCYESQTGLMFLILIFSQAAQCILLTVRPPE